MPNSNCMKNFGRKKKSKCIDEDGILDLGLCICFTPISCIVATCIHYKTRGSKPKTKTTTVFNNFKINMIFFLCIWLFLILCIIFFSEFFFLSLSLSLLKLLQMVMFKFLITFVDSLMNWYLESVWLVFWEPKKAFSKLKIMFCKSNFS